MTEGLSSGNAIDFGPFQLRLSIKGTFPAANAPFDPMTNRLEVYLTPGKALLAAVNSLAPVNATPMDRPWIESICTNGLSELAVVKLGRRVVIVGTKIRLDAAREDEGVWLEDDTGEKLAKAEIIETDNVRALVKFAAGSVVPGKYRLALYTRAGGAVSGQVAAIRRKVKVVAGDL